MTKTEQPSEKTMRQMMPPNYLPIIAKESGLDKVTISRAVLTENRRSKAWPYILKLAKEYEKQQEEERRLGLAS